MQRTILPPTSSPRKRPSPRPVAPPAPNVGAPTISPVLVSAKPMSNGREAMATWRDGKGIYPVMYRLSDGRPSFYASWGKDTPPALPAEALEALRRGDTYEPAPVIEPVIPPNSTELKPALTQTAAGRLDTEAGRAQTMHQTRYRVEQEEQVFRQSSEGARRGILAAWANGATAVPADVWLKAHGFLANGLLAHGTANVPTIPSGYAPFFARDRITPDHPNFAFFRLSVIEERMTRGEAVPSDDRAYQAAQASIRAGMLAVGVIPYTLITADTIRGVHSLRDFCGQCTKSVWVEVDGVWNVIVVDIDRAEYDDLLASSPISRTEHTPGSVTHIICPEPYNKNTCSTLSERPFVEVI